MDIFDYVPPPDLDEKLDRSIKDFIEWREYMLAKMRENLLLDFTKLVNYDRTKTTIYNSRAIEEIA